MDHEAFADPVFIGRDVFHKSESVPDYYNNIGNVLGSDYIDEANDWMIMAEKSYIECDELNR